MDKITMMVVGLLLGGIMVLPAADSLQSQASITTEDFSMDEFEDAGTVASSEPGPSVKSGKRSICSLFPAMALLALVMIRPGLKNSP